ncbi:MAG: hypothetical protein R3301_08375, partial [Saprospiraceae bacterium]|nr:hypothetical protein [Saprospiraceae bacterium]
HVLWLQFDYKRDRGETFADFFSYARGYNRITSDWIYRAGVNYQFPVIYPDFGFAGIAYFKRLRANLFFDYSRSSLENVLSVYRSTGIELMFDLELFNVEPVTLAWRWSYLHDVDPAEPTRSYRFGFFTPFERL